MVINISFKMQYCIEFYDIVHTYASTCVSGEQYSVNGSNLHQFRATDVLISLCVTDNHEEELETLLAKYSTQDVKFEVKNKLL